MGDFPKAGWLMEHHSKMEIYLDGTPILGKPPQKIIIDQIYPQKSAIFPGNLALLRCLRRP